LDLPLVTAKQVEVKQVTVKQMELKQAIWIG
jgi:hypothetical protein